MAIFEENTEINLGLEDLVGEGKKYSDADALAKAYANSEAFLEKLKSENATLRAAQDAEEARRKQLEDEKRNKEQVPDGDNRHEPPKQSPPKDVDFRSQIRDTVKALNEEETGLRNLDTAAAKLVEIHGSEAKANEAIKNKANELGVTVDWMKENAMRSPTAFYNMMGLSGSPSNRLTPAPSSDVRIDERGNTKNFEYYDKLRKDNSKLYWSREMQLEMQQQARANPDFYKR